MSVLVLMKGSFERRYPSLQILLESRKLPGPEKGGGGGGLEAKIKIVALSRVLNKDMKRGPSLPGPVVGSCDTLYRFCPRSHILSLISLLCLCLGIKQK